MKRTFILTLFLTPLALSSCGGSSAKKELILPTYEDDKSITVGVWNGSYTSLDDSRIKDLSDAGVNLLVGHFDINDAILDLCEAHGVSMLTDSRDWNGEVPSYSTKKAFKGYCVADEPSFSQFDSLVSKKSLWDTKMPDKDFYVNLFPGYTSGSSLGGSLDTYVKTFTEKLKVNELSFDYYPLKVDAAGNTTLRDSYFSDLDTYSYYAREAEIPLWLSILTAGHQSYVTPTTEEIRWQMAVGMAFGAQGICHYIYSSHESGYTPMVDWPNGNKTEVFDRVATCDEEIEDWDEVYMSFAHKGIAKIAGEDSDTNWGFSLMTHDVPVSEFGGIKSIVSDHDALCGIFEDGTGSKGFMVTNANNPADEAADEMTITFDSSYSGVLVISRDGRNSYYLDGNNYKLSLEAGEGKFLIPLKGK